MPEVQWTSRQIPPNSCIVEGVVFSNLNVDPKHLIPLDSTWLTLVPLDWHWFHSMTLDSTWSHFSYVSWMMTVYSKFMAFDWQRFSHNFSLFLTFPHSLSLFVSFYHFLSYLNIFYHFGGYHLDIQNPSKTNPSKSGYQHRCPDLSNICWRLYSEVAGPDSPSPPGQTAQLSLEYR